MLGPYDAFCPQRSADTPVHLVALFVPYVAVVLGMYGLESGWAAILFYHVGIVLVTAALGEGAQLRSLVRGWHWPFGLGLSLGCLASGAGLYLLWPLLGEGACAALGDKLRALGLSGFSWQVFCVYYAVVNPLLEELYWRGVLGSAARGLAPTDIFFAGYHILVLVKLVPWYWAVLAAAFLSGAAWLWRQIAARQGGLAVPAVTHLVADASIISAGALLVAG